MNIVEIFAVVAIVVYVIARQALGEAIRAKRLIILPGVLALIGALDLAKRTVHTSTSDVLLIAVGAAIAIVIGIGQGHLMRLEERDGGLWGQLPRQGLWLWVLLYASRGVLIGVAHATSAHVAAGAQAELLILGINRLGQAAIVAWRAQMAGIPFAPESNRRGTGPSLRGVVHRASPSSSARPPADAAATPSARGDAPAPLSAGTRWANVARQISAAATDVASSRRQSHTERRADRRRSRHRR